MSVLGIGIDLVDLERVARLLERKGDHALSRLLTADERAYICAKANPVPHFAARLAAKEAVFKALQPLGGCRGVGWRDIEIRRESDGRVGVRLHGLAVARAEELGGFVVHLSITHSAHTAGAVAVLLRTG